MVRRFFGNLIGVVHNRRMVISQAIANVNDLRHFILQVGRRQGIIKGNGRLHVGQLLRVFGVFSKVSRGRFIFSAMLNRVLQVNVVVTHVGRVLMTGIFVGIITVPGQT